MAARPIPPMMSALPDFRTTPYCKPFTFTGTDYFGPYTVSIGRRTEKRWGCLFTCMVTRAVYLELAQDMSADSFIICFRNLQFRRGRVQELYSDNGTNFVGANNEFRKMMRRLSDGGIKWHFNPPVSPHFGGAWERIVKEVKSLLHQDQPTIPEHTLRATLTEAEFIINSRPLTHIPLESEDDEVLTPNHFLMGCAGEATCSINDASKAEVTRKQWIRAQILCKTYWDRWVKEYLPTLAKRTKWQDKAKPLMVGDIVIFADEVQKGIWHKGRITNTKTAKDGQVRSATVKTVKGEYDRPAVKLAVLEVRKEDSLPLTENLMEKKNNSSSAVNFVGVISNQKSKQKSKNEHGTLQKTFLMTMIILSLANTINALNVKPVQEGGTI